MVLAALAVVAALLTPADAAALPLDAQEPATLPDLPALDGASLWRSSSHTLFQTTSTGSFKAVTAGGRHTCGLKTDATITCWGHNGYGEAVAPGGTFSAVSAGWGHTCGLKTDATITCWGHNGSGEAVAPGGTFSAVSAGWLHTCGLKTDATITCWGHNGYGEAVAPGGTFSAVSAGWRHTCGLKTDATITCWGRNDFGQAVAPGGTFSAVSAGEYHTCGLKTDATITCWGHNGYGEAVAPGGTFSAVSAGWRHTCGLKTDATITCWGHNDFGDFGQAVAPGGTFSAVSAGLGHTCGLKTDATITCWGNNDSGEAVAPGGTFSAVSAGEYHTCGLKTDATITCWGRNDFGQAVAPGGTFSAVSAGWGHTCGLKTDATITCWGNNDSGEAVAPGGTFSAVSAGKYQKYHTCGLKTDATITCWGNNDSGEAVAPGGTFSAVSAGWLHTCGLKTDATITCWGHNGDGRADAPGGTFSAVTAGWGHTCGLKTDATITCWGDNNYGRADAPGGTFSAVTAGWGHTCGLKTDATITCWGHNGSGEAVAPGGTFSAVSAGWGHTCGLKTDATITCWGRLNMRTADPGGAGGSAVGEQVPGGTPGSVEDDPGRTPATQTTITTEEVSPEPGSLAEEEVPEAEGIVTVLDADDIVVQLARVSGLRYDFGAERAVWEPVPGARSYLLAMWDGEQTRQLNVECCSYIIYLSQSDVEQINVRASNNLVNNPVEGPWSGWVSLLPEKVSDLQYERRPTINLILLGTVAPDSITWRPVSNANAYDMEWTYSWAGLDITLKRYDISPECAPRCRSYLVRRPSDDSRFRVRASNAAGKGPWSDWSSIRPERPDQVTGLRHDLANKRFVWSRASGAATYVVRLWDGETGRNVEQDACCSYAIDAKRDGITHFKVQAVNSGGGGPWPDWQRILENPGNPTGPKVERDGLSGLRVWWRAPRDSGSSPISHYEVRYTRADYDRVDWSRTYYEADGNSHTKEGLEQGVEYLVWLISVNKDGLRSGGSGAYGTTASCPGGSRGAKYRKVDRTWPKSDYFEAAQSFETVDGTWVTAGTKAGKIGDTSLSQFGCSWVFEDAGVVESDASVSGNAIVRDEAVVRDEASVYGDAIVEDDARIFDDAKVYDRAHVRDDATVRDHARVYGDAEVWGNDTEIQHYARVKEDAKVWDGATVKDHARVYGDAKVSGGAVIAGSGDNSDDGGVYAEIYGKAEVSGEAVVDGNAEVYGNARIYGEASVSGNAHVYGDAKVFGDAKVSGYARVFGTAEIGDGMEVSCSIRLHDDVSDQVHNFSISRIAALQPFQQECIYNGEFEFRRAALELYFKTWVDFESTLTDCLDDSDEAKRTTADLMAVPSSNVDRARKEIAEAIVSGCDRLEKHQKIIEKFAPGAVDIVVAYALGFGSAWRSSTFTKSLIDAVDLGNDLTSLSDAHAKLTAEIEEIRRTDPTKAELRRQLWGSGVAP